MKKYIHEKQNQLKSALIHEGQIKRNPYLFPNILDEEDQPVDPSTITRKNELTGAGFQYMMSVVDYYCTHHFDELHFVPGSAKRVKIPTMTWGMFIDIATGGIAEQRERAKAAILNLRATQKPVHFLDFDYDTNGISYSMVPFIIDVIHDDGEKIATSSAAKLARLIKARQSKEKEGIVLRGKADQPYKVIKYIDILFAKPLYEGFFRKGTGNYSFPSGMYAHFYQNWHQAVLLNKKETQNPVPLNADSEPYIDFYCRLARYFTLHNNLDKGKNYNHIFKSLGEIMADVQPAMVNWKNGQPLPKDVNKAHELLLCGFAAMYSIEGFSVYPTFEGRTPDGKYSIGLYRTPEEMFQATEKAVQRTDFRQKL